MKNNKEEIIHLKTKINQLNSKINEEKFINERTKELLFILENQNELLNKQINKIKQENEKFIKKMEHENRNKQFIFSIIITIFNTEKYLSETIDSIINQNFILDNVQIVMIDDGSTDNSRKICENYVKKYPNNILYFYQENQGLSVARNKGLQIAQGRFISFLDSGDKLESNTLNEIFYHFNKFGNKIDIISMGKWQLGVEEGSIPISEKYEKTDIIDISKDFNFSITPVNSVFIRRSIATNFKFNEKITLSEDSEFINQLILKNVNLE